MQEMHDMSKTQREVSQEHARKLYCTSQRFMKTAEQRCMAEAVKKLRVDTPKGCSASTVQ